MDHAPLSDEELSVLFCDFVTLCFVGWGVFVDPL